MQCSYFDAGLCRSCTHMGQPYAEQLAAKDALCRKLLAGFGAIDWLPPVASTEAGYRNKAKMVVGGTLERPTLGILDGRGQGVDLQGCGILMPGIQDALPALAAFITRAGLTPYNVPDRSGEAKYVLVTEAPGGELLVRFVVRNEATVDRIREHLPWLQEVLPRAVVVSVNLLPEHKAVVEGDREIVLTERETLTMRLGEVALHLRPQSFFQTNTAVAEQLYAQAQRWVDEAAPSSVWDLYCGVGGFALHVAAPGRRVVGVETSADAVASARLSARDAGLSDTTFEVGDATAFLGGSAGVTQIAGVGEGDNASASAGGSAGVGASEIASARGGAGPGDTAFPRPELVIVNPPRRGIGPDLAARLDASGARTVIYSSCNPVSLAKDLAAMPSFVVRRARMLDMFPQTGHLEVITLLERR
ncbi:methyltransferase domain-containing protein [Herbiconiux sp. CPCC 205763]|uniref:Methyltransferase domain-containing protein n=1 Tax=Herbiconiux aconitum TaxID=2970913 RepID=A0ABT2GNR8_9MICO|nr:methyltransferase domain-containing protein [Herbiconiux aconitum]MCS5717828.1 methyltransferase domain-containing protein [Herbiconiux aconitum]